MLTLSRWFLTAENFLDCKNFKDSKEKLEPIICVNKLYKDNQHCGHYNQTLWLPVFASTDNNKSTDDDADEGDAHSDGDPCH